MSKNKIMTLSERAEIWRRFKRGENMRSIADALSRNYRTTYSFVASHGGIVPRVARPRRSARSLTVGEREEILRHLAAGASYRSIAAAIGKAPSTISREVARNGGRKRYRALVADLRAWNQAKRPKACKLATAKRLRELVSAKLMLNWSPEQIAAWLRKAFPSDKKMQISHEAIYRSLFVQARGLLKRELLSHLRTGRLLRQSKNATRDGRGKIPDAVSIRERPAEVEDRAVPGHWEGDLIAGKANGSHIATLVERKTRYTMLVKLDGKDTASVVDALAKQIRMLPRELRKSITSDRGTEMTDHKRFSMATNVKVYFCDPRSPWQRGTNENTNRLLRQYLPKQTDLAHFTQAELNRIARELNERPRETLEFASPAEKMQHLLR